MEENKNQTTSELIKLINEEIPWTRNFEKNLETLKAMKIPQEKRCDAFTGTSAYIYRTIVNPKDGTSYDIDVVKVSIDENPATNEMEIRIDDKTVEAFFRELNDDELALRNPEKLLAENKSLKLKLADAKDMICTLRTKYKERP